MKKLTIIAAVALLAGVACTKEVVNTTPPQAISFQVASYMPQTRANVKFDESSSFITYAWFHPTAGSATEFMTKETVSLQGSSGSAYWSPARTYFWPKTGYINFYSYSGLPAAWDTYTSVTDGTVSFGTSSNNVTVGITDDVLLAEAAYRYSAANYDSDLYHDPIVYNSTDVKGVPTLFHHMLAKVSFIIKFDATGFTGADAAKHKWELTVNKADLTYVDKGYVTATYGDPGSTNLSWPYGGSGANEGVQWNAGTTTTLAAPQTGYTAAEISANSALDAETIGGTAAQTISGGDQAAVGGSASSGKEIIKAVSVLPQVLGTNVKLALCYSLRHIYDSDDDSDFTDETGLNNVVETVNMTGAALEVGGTSYPSFHAALNVADFYTDASDKSGTKVPNWQISHKYVYTITVKPDHTITFSPAVVDWADTINAGTIVPDDL